MVAVILVLGGLSLVLPPGRPLAYRVARHFGLINRPAPLQPGDKLPAVTLNTVGGTPIVVRRKPGRGMLIDIFASWCVPCQGEMTALVSVAPLLQREGVDVVGIDRQESPSRVAEVVQTYKIPYPVYINDGGDAAAALDERVIPTTIFVDRHSVVRLVFMGPLSKGDLLAAAKEI